MGEPRRQHQPALFEFKRRLLARAGSPPNAVEDPLAELARVVGGGGRIVSANADLRDAPSLADRKPGAALTARPPKIDLKPLQWPDEDQSPHDAVADPSFSDHADLGETAQEAWRSHAHRLAYSNENFRMAPAGDARLRLRNRKHANTSLYVTAAAVVVAGVFAILIFRPGASALLPAEHRADTAAVVKIPPAGTNSTPAPRLNTSAVAAAQPSSTPPPKPVGDAAPVAANLAPSPQDEGLFLQPRRVRTIPIYGGGVVAEPANMTPNEAQATPVSGLTFGQLVEAQTLQTPASAGPKTSARDSAGPTNGPGADVASVEPPTVPGRSAVKPAPNIAATEATYAAILASPATESAARGMLGELQRKYGAALGAHRLTYHRAKGAEGIVYEVRAAGLAGDEAQALCAQLSSAGASCQVRSQ